MGGAQRELWVNSFSYGCIKDRLCLDFSLLSIFEDNIGHLDPETPPPFLASVLDRLAGRSSARRATSRPSGGAVKSVSSSHE